jgi:hypothetical protein
MCETKVWGVLGGKPWFYTFWGCFGVFRGLVYLAHKTKNQRNKRTENNTIIIKEISSSYYIYIYISIQGGAIIGGYMRYRPFIDSPLDSIDIYMIDSMILWMMMMVTSLSVIDSFNLLFGLIEPGVFLGVLGLEMCVTKVWGFWGVNPGFTHFGVFLGCFGVWFV